MTSMTARNSNRKIKEKKKLLFNIDLIMHKMEEISLGLHPEKTQI